MTLERRYHPDGRLDRVLLTECPACGVDLTQVKHTSKHIRSHEPEDFGLPPRGEIATEPTPSANVEVPVA